VGEVEPDLQGRPAIIAYDLMNEPFNDGGIAQGAYVSDEKAWEDATQRALNEIRKNGDGTLVMVPTYCGAGQVQKKHKRKWISDPANNHMYTTHQYFDPFRGPGTGGGTYEFSYSREAAYLSARGY
jgi:aryl-phospho-beta-D-glucosidase BglC (GH1 family)